MAVEKRSLISRLKTTRKANVASAEPGTKSSVTSKRVNAKRQLVAPKRRYTSKSEITITKTTDKGSTN